jgi:hypothetical protein
MVSGLYYRSQWEDGTPICLSFTKLCTEVTKSDDEAQNTRTWLKVH